MVERLISLDSTKDAEQRIKELIEQHGEWLCVRDSKATPLTKSECDFRVEHERLIFSCWGDEGAIHWRVTAWEWTGEKLLLEASRRMGAERAKLELVPRASIKAAMAMIGAKRRERCQRLAELACAILPGAKIERVGLSAGARPAQPGAFARVILRHKRERIAVSGIVAELVGKDVDAFLSSTLLWFTRASDRVRPPYIQRFWFIVESDWVEPLTERLSLLRDDLRRVSTLHEIDDAWAEIKSVELPELDELLMRPTARFRSPAETELSASAASFIALAPEAIDVVRSRHGETLRFHGLAFARVRKLMNRERVWFGIEGARRRVLDESTEEECAKLLLELQEHRSAASADQNHALYRAAPESWLESILRRDITRLDPGLRLAPLYAQFRSSLAGGSRPIDLLALRRDGRLVVIELKVREDREHVLQGADYWRRVEAHRRCGNLARARLFGDAQIEDEPPLVYLVAPGLRFHRAFDTLARAITPSIEIYRFDINEDWRAGVRVMRRCDFT
ncbi:MAG: hypothetical protein DMF68_20700 [Acidobacteria bacterium]|nr:MAG: hypothetical protein DMF68_20700 [Acidobacteriota bacterium]